MKLNKIILIFTKTAYPHSRNPGFKIGIISIPCLKFWPPLVPLKDHLKKNDDLNVALLKILWLYIFGSKCNKA